MRHCAAEGWAGTGYGMKAPTGSAPADPRATLAQRIVIAPRLIDGEAARGRVDEWLAGVAPAESAPLRALFSSHPIIATLLQSLSESSPYLWDLASREPDRLLRLLNADPDPY